MAMYGCNCGEKWINVKPWGAISTTHEILGIPSSANEVLMIFSYAQDAVMAEGIIPCDFINSTNRARVTFYNPNGMTLYQLCISKNNNNFEAYMTGGSGYAAIYYR